MLLPCKYRKEETYAQITLLSQFPLRKATDRCRRIEKGAIAGGHCLHCALDALNIQDEIFEVEVGMQGLAEGFEAEQIRVQYIDGYSGMVPGITSVTDNFGSLSR